MVRAMRLLALGLVAMVCCGFGTYNRAADSLPKYAVKDGLYLMDGWFGRNGKPHPHRIVVNQSGIYEISSQDEDGVSYSLLYGARLFKVKGLPENVYALEYRSVSRAFQEPPTYSLGFVEVVDAGKFRLFHTEFFGGMHVVPDGLVDLLVPEGGGLNNPQRDYDHFVAAFWEANREGAVPISAEFLSEDF